MGLSEQADLVVKLSLRDELSRGIRSAQTQIKGLGVNLGKIGGNISRGMGNAVRNIERIGVIAATAGAGALVATVKAASDWQSAFAGVLKTMDLTETEAAQMETAIRKMATTIPVSATELAGIAEAAGALGVAKADVLGFTDVVAKLGVTTDLTSDAAATSLGHLTTTLGLAGDQYAHLGNALVDLGNHGASTESQILGMTESVAGASKIIGLTADQTLGWGAALANTGEEVEAGGSSLQKFFLGIFKSVSKGGKDLEQVGKAAGMTGAAFRDSFGKDASGALEGLIVHLGTLSKAEQVATLEALGFTDIRITRALLKLVGNTDNLTDSLNVSTDAWAKNNAMEVEAGKRFATFDSRLQVLKNSLKDAAITIGNELLPQLTDLTKEATDFLGKPETQAQIKQFAKDLAQGFRELVEQVKKVDWASVLNAIKGAAGFARDLMKAFVDAPGWLQQAVLTGWGLNKLTGGAVGGIVAELGKGLIKGVLGMNAGVVNLTAGTVVSKGGVATGGAAAGGGFGLGGLLKGVAVAAGGALVVELIAAQFGELQRMTAAASAAVEEKIAGLKDNNLTESLSEIAGLGNTINDNSRDLVKAVLMQTGTGQKETVDAFKALEANLERTAQTPQERAAAASALDGLARTIADKYTMNKSDADALYNQLVSIYGALKNPPPPPTGPTGATTVVPGPGFTEYMHAQATGDAQMMNELRGLADSGKGMRDAFVKKWDDLQEAINQAGKHGPEIKKELAHDLDVSTGELRTLRHASIAAMAKELGTTTSAIREARRQAHGDDAAMAAKLGISVEQLRSIRENGRTTAVQTTKIAGKDFSPKITVNNTFAARIGITGRTIISTSDRQRILIGKTVE